MSPISSGLRPFAPAVAAILLADSAAAQDVRREITNIASMFQCLALNRPGN